MDKKDKKEFGKVISKLNFILLKNQRNMTETEIKQFLIGHELLEDLLRRAS